MEIYEKNRQPNSRPEPVISSKGKYWGAIFLWFGLGVLLSGIVGFALPYVLAAMAGSAAQVDTIYTVLVIISCIIVFPLMFILQMGVMKNKSSLTIVCYVLYSVFFGVLLSSSLSYAGAELSLYALLITGGIMAIMGVVGVLLKDKLNRLSMIAMSLFFGGFLISIVTFFFFNNAIYWISSFIMLVAIILITAVDVGRIKNTINVAPQLTTSVIIYCSFILYTDFIYIFIRILQLLTIANRRK